MNKIICLGEALIDMICTDKGKPLSQGDNFLKKAGGAPANVAAAIAALGGRAAMAAKVGIDPFGDHLVDVMQSMGVNTQYVFRDADHFTTFAFVSLMENGERDFYFNRGADAELSVGDINNIDVSQFGIFHFGSATAFLPGQLQHAYKHLMQLAVAQNAFTCFDPNYRHLLFQYHQPSFIVQSWAYLTQCNFFKVSDEEAMLLTSTSSVEDASAALQQRTSSTFVITLGSRGTLLRVNNEVELVPSIPVVPVDTTGAGDAFVGAILYQLSKLNEEERTALQFTDWKGMTFNANKAGARTCQYMGAMEAFRHLSNSIFE